MENCNPLLGSTYSKCVSSCASCWDIEMMDKIIGWSSYSLYCHIVLCFKSKEADWYYMANPHPNCPDLLPQYIGKSWMRANSSCLCFLFHLAPLPPVIQWHCVSCLCYVGYFQGNRKFRDSPTRPFHVVSVQRGRRKSANCSTWRRKTMYVSMLSEDHCQSKKVRHSFTSPQSILTAESFPDCFFFINDNYPTIITN